jgi:hypothetical protein
VVPARDGGGFDNLVEGGLRLLASGADRWVALPYEFVEVGEVVGGHGLRRR